MKKFFSILFLIGAALILFSGKFLINVKAADTLESNGGYVYPDYIEIPFNIDYPDAEIPSNIEVFIDTQSIGQTNSFEKMNFGFQIKIEISCNEIPQANLIDFEYYDEGKVFGYEPSRFEFKATYEDGTTSKVKAQYPVILLINNDFVTDQTLFDLYCGEGIVLDDPPTGSGSGGFADVVGTTFEEYINNLFNDGIINGYSDGLYHPERDVKRGAMAKFVKNAFEIETDTSCGDFPDVKPGHSFYEEVTTLKCKGIIEGYSDGTYRPENGVTRGQVTKFITLSMEYKGVQVDYTLSNNFPDVPKGHPFYKFVSYLTSVEFEGEKVIRGYSDGNYHPDRILDRGAMAKIVDISRKAVEILPKGDPIYPEQTSTDIGIVKISGLETSDATDYIVTGYYPENYVEEKKAPPNMRCFSNPEYHSNEGNNNICYGNAVAKDDGGLQTLEDCENLANSVADSIGLGPTEIYNLEVLNTDELKGCYFKVDSDDGERFLESEHKFISQSYIGEPKDVVVYYTNAYFSQDDTEEEKQAIHDSIQNFTLEVK